MHFVFIGQKADSGFILKTVKLALCLFLWFGCGHFTQIRVGHSWLIEIKWVQKLQDPSEKRQQDPQT